MLFDFGILTEKLCGYIKFLKFDVTIKKKLEILITRVDAVAVCINVL